MKTLSEQKQIMREMIKKEVEQLSTAYCKRADRGILEHIITLPEYEKAQTVFCYVGRSSEINTIPILEDILQKGKTLAVPKCIDKGIMIACKVQCLTQLQPGKFGIYEPVKECTLVEPTVIDLGIIPCCACGKDGRRLGYGGGYYDRYLQRADFTKTALCRSMMLQENIPVGEYDVSMDIVISEQAIHFPHL